MKELYNCIDTGSKYCPCGLADTLNCISCSHLKGEDFCDCNWNGVCILYEYYMHNMKSRGVRSSYQGLVTDKKTLEENLFLLKIETDVDLIKELDAIGSYVFINRFNTNSYYDAPMSILDVDEKFIYIAYHEIGPKTTGITKGKNLTMKGPYWNGIIGEGKLSDVKDSTIMIVGRGISQSSIVMPINKLIEKNNKIFLFLDKGKTHSLYCLDFIKDKNLIVEEISLFSKLAEEKLLDFVKMNSIDIVFSAGAEMVHRKIKPLLAKAKIQPKWFTTNNNILCCGEGICGSCIRKTNSGDRIKTCKTVINPMNFY